MSSIYDFKIKTRDGGGFENSESDRRKRLY